MVVIWGTVTTNFRTVRLTAIACIVGRLHSGHIREDGFVSVIMLVDLIERLPGVLVSPI